MTRFVEKEPGQIWLQRALYGPFRGFRITDESPVLVSVTVPPEVLNKIMIQLEAWYALERLGPEALVNFTANLETTHTVGLRMYVEVAVSANPNMANGRLVNISARGYATLDKKLIAGFTIHDQGRKVLLRAVGPGLRQFNVNDAMADPYITLFKVNTPIGYNNDWNGYPDAGEIPGAATKVGAFPLDPGSKDAAMIVELEPGSYTIQAEPATGEGGTVLLEAYSVPSPERAD